MWIVCITSVRHVLTVNGYGGRQTKENEKSWCFKGWETLVKKYLSENPLVAKRLFRINRAEVLGIIMDKGFSFPLIYDTALHLLNHIGVKDNGLVAMEDPSLKEELDDSFGIIC